jgi:hypothetical protein
MPAQAYLMVTRKAAEREQGDPRAAGRSAN